MKFTKSHSWLLLVILIIALALRLWGIGFGLPHRYHIDEPPYVVAALRIAKGDLLIEYPYNSPNLFQFILTAAYAGLYVLGRLLGYFQSPDDVARLYQVDPSIFYLIARGISATFGAATVGILYYIGKIVRNSYTGLIAALFLTLSFIHAQDAHFAVTDTFITFFTTCCILFSLLYLETTRRRHLVIAGLAGGVAFGLKYLPAPILIVPIIALLITKSKLKSYLVFVLAVSAGFLIAFPAPLFSFRHFLLHFNKACQQAASALGGCQVGQTPVGLYYLNILGWGMGWSLFMMAIIGILMSAFRRHLKVLAIVCGIAFYYIGICCVHSFFARYSLPLVPLLCLLAADALVAVSPYIQGRLSTQAFRLLHGFLILLFVFGSILAVLRYDYLLTQTDTRTQAKTWIEQNIPSGARLLVQWFGPPLSTPSDPEPDSNDVYDVVLLDPFQTGPQHYSLQEYLDHDVQYIVVNSFNANLSLEDERENELRKGFYQSLEQSTELLAEFRPYDGISEPLFEWEQLYSPANELFGINRPGPTIKIYKLCKACN